MVVIRFGDETTERRALGFMAGRFSFTAWKDGGVLVPPAALAGLAAEGISFTVEGLARYEQNVPTIRDSAAVAVQ